MSSTARKLAKGSAFRTVNFFAQVLVAFFLMPFVVHSLGDRMYGFWTLIGTFIGYYGLLDLGLSSAVQRHVAGAIGAGNKEELNRYFNTSLLLFTGLGLVALLITVILAVLSSFIWNSPDDADLFWKVILILGVNMAIELPLKTFGGVLVAELRFDILSTIELMSLVLRTTLVVLAISLGYRVLGLAVATLIAGIPGKVLFVYFTMKTQPSLRFKREYWQRGTAKTLFTYSSFSFIAQMGHYVRFHTDAFIITAFMTLSAVTHYRIASLMVQYFISLMSACMGVITPLFSQQDGANDLVAMKKSFFFATKISVCLSSFIAFGLIAWGKPFIERWMGPEYLDAYPVLVILSLGSLFAIGQSPSVALMFATSKHKLFALFNSIEGVFNILLSILLVKHYGLIGVALGTFIPMAVIRLFIQPIYFCRVTSIQYGEYIYRLLRTVAVACISLVIPALISLRYAAPDYSILFALGFISLCVYSLSVWFIEFSHEEKRIFQKVLFPRLSVRKVDF